MFPFTKARNRSRQSLAWMALLCLALAPIAAPCQTAVADTCVPPAKRPAAPVPGHARPKAAMHDAGDPFVAAAMGVLPLASGFYVSDTPVKGIAFTLADIMLIGTILQIRSNDSIPRKDISLYYLLLGGVNILDAGLSVLQVRSDAAKRVSLHIVPSDHPQVILGFRF